MNGWTQEVFARLCEAKQLSVAFASVADGASKLGFEHCAYGLRLPLPFTKHKTLMLSTYDLRWQQRYQEAGYLSIDPTVLHGVRSLSPLVWSDDLFLGVPEMWAEARSFGLRVGWAQSCFGGAGRVGMLSLARSSESLTDAEIGAHDPLLRWLVNTAHLALSSFLMTDQHVDFEPLTARQTEVLRWTADGKSSAEIAAILHISVDTVNYHVRNAIERLRANNKVSAVARSSRLGILD